MSPNTCLCACAFAQDLPSSFRSPAPCGKIVHTSSDPAAYDAIMLNSLPQQDEDTRGRPKHACSAPAKLHARQAQRETIVVEDADVFSEGIRHQNAVGKGGKLIMFLLLVFVLMLVTVMLA